MRPPLPASIARRGGYILMEVMLATTIFAIAGVSLAIVLNDAISAGIRVQRATRVTWNLESKLNEARLQFAEGTNTSKPDADGIVYETAISRMNLLNEKNQPVAGMYNIVITARWKEGNEDAYQSAQMYVYQP